jgi:hypothetical protein
MADFTESGKLALSGRSFRYGIEESGNAVPKAE